MNSFWIFVVSAFSISIPVMAAIARFPRLHRRYIPLAVLFATGLLNECISYFMINRYRNNLVNSNIYTLIEFCLFLWFFYRIKNQQFIWILVAGSLGLAAWVTDNLWLHTLKDNNTIFRILSSCIILWLSMDKINQITFDVFRHSYKRTDLTLCLCFLVYYSYRTFIHIFNLFSVNLPAAFYANLWLILSLINLVTNLIYTIAILWIPKRQEFILRS